MKIWKFWIISTTSILTIDWHYVETSIKYKCVKLSVGSLYWIKQVEYFLSSNKSHLEILSDTSFLVKRLHLK